MEGVSSFVTHGKVFRTEEIELSSFLVTHFICLINFKREREQKDSEAS